MNQHGNPTSGCTAVTAIMRGRQLHVANVGDSRAYLCRGGKAKALTVDHVPSDFKEHERIEKVNTSPACMLQRASHEHNPVVIS